jgi:hypothetical protein
LDKLDLKRETNSETTVSLLLAQPVHVYTKEIEQPRKDRASVILPSTMNVIYVFQNVEKITSNAISKLFN